MVAAFRGADTLPASTATNDPEGPRMLLRPATLDDIPQLHRVRIAVRENRLSDPTRISAQDYAIHLSELGRGWVIEIDTVIAGFAIVRFSDGNLWALFVDPAHEGRGLGSILHEAMLAGLATHGLRRAWLTTEAGSRAEAFYRRKGWQDFPPHPAGEVRMRWEADA